MTTPEDIPPEIGALFAKYKTKQIKPKDETKLLSWIIKMKQVPGFTLKSIVISAFGYIKADYDRLVKALSRMEARLEANVDLKLKELESDALAKFIEETWNEVKSIATGTVIKWRDAAIEHGYFDKDKEHIRMKDFIEDACDFYVEKRDMIAQVESRVRDLEAVATMFAQISKPNVLRIVALRSYMEFVNIVTQLAAKGIPVPESIIIEVKNTVDTVILSTYPQEKEMPAS